jgi:adenylate kinase family enzyme
MKVLIFGPSGAGKTYLSKALKKLGINSVDADLIGPLRSWFYGDDKVEYQENADKDWLDNHSFRWDRDYLK